MDGAQHTRIVNFIWGIADDVLRDVFVRGKYRDVILPMTVIRRLDAVLEPTKAKVVAEKTFLDGAGIREDEQDGALRLAAGQTFYNTSSFTLRGLLADPNQLEANFRSFLDGFSPNVQEILDKFEFRNQIPRLVGEDALGLLVQKFQDPRINLGPRPVLDGAGNVTLPGLDNHAMGTVFEELIRRFNEENNEEAGEHFTPRDVVALMANLIFRPIADRITDGTYLVYDGACGTGGMLTVAEETLQGLAAEHGKRTSIHLYGQEINGETYAISKADLLIKGENADNMRSGSTLASDAFPDMSFDFMLSNPPYGKSWTNDLERLGGKKGMRDGRFVVQHGDDPDFSLVTRTSDGQLMFLANKLAKMKHDTPLGSRIAEVHNGSALFTGDAGQGESNIRRWIIENDWLEAIVALPEKIFYNTGIATYVWILTNRKPEHRRGRVQLIDATQWFRPLRRNLGQRNREMTAEDIDRVVATFERFEETEQSRIFPNEAFGYRKVTVERPLRLATYLTDDRLATLADLATAAKDTGLIAIATDVASRGDTGAYLDFARARLDFETAARRHGSRWTAKREKLMREALCERSDDANPIILTTDVPSLGDPARDRLDGRFTETAGRYTRLNTYEPDPELRDTEQIPLLEPGGVAGFIEREVWPHVPDAWVDPASERIGYEISFTRYFYKPQRLRTLDEIRADILALEAETDGLLHEILA